MFSMGAAVFFRKSVRRWMGIAAFTALLMTLCNKSFSATQFALLSALSAVVAFMLVPQRAGVLLKRTAGRHSTFFSVVAAVPGCYCCWSVGKRWNIAGRASVSFPARNTVAPKYNFTRFQSCSRASLCWRNMAILLTMNAVGLH